jgi:hypothetical protein
VPRKRSSTRSTAPATRSDWLAAAVPHISARVFEPAGFVLPRIRVTCDLPIRGARYALRIGECWPRWQSEDETNLIYISPRICMPEVALDIFVHELVHAIDDCANGHRGRFRTIATRVGLTGKMTATRAGPGLAATLVDIATSLGSYPDATAPLSPAAPPA